ncbi:MAG: hypothetical protein H6983_08700 [Ectothiorhodospiraceae bacterium]|nr:hypothetical protein [Chromatiales bacterium]MCP5154228.1 hypothetical protein [Ectothiorhodospiraceae bacterium]
MNDDGKRAGSISVRVSPDQARAGATGAGFGAERGFGSSRNGGGLMDLDVDGLADSMRDMRENLARIFGDIQQVGRFELSEIEVGFEINGKGGFSLIGTAEASAGAALKLKFKPPAG